MDPPSRKMCIGTYSKSALIYWKLIYVSTSRPLVAKRLHFQKFLKYHVLLMVLLSLYPMYNGFPPWNWKQVAKSYATCSSIQPDAEWGFSDPGPTANVQFLQKTESTLNPNIHYVKDTGLRARFAPGRTEPSCGSRGQPIFSDYGLVGLIPKHTVLWGL